jgi:hypothetical protein
MGRELLLFIHGLGGHGEKTWGKFLDLVRRDPDLGPRFQVGVFRYPTSLVRIPFSKPLPKFQTLALALRTQIEQEFGASESVNLVCHSLGGLIARKYLIDEVKRGRDLRVRRLILYAVPNNGAQLATNTKYISWWHPQLRQLCRYSDLIADLNDDWFTLEMTARVAVRYILAGQDAVVDQQSAQSFWGNVNLEVLADKTHTSCVKPTGPDDLAFRVLKNFVSPPRVRSEPATAGDTPPSDGSSGSSPSPVTDSELIADIASMDPLVAGHAAVQLAGRRDLIEQILDRFPRGPVPEESVKSVLRRHPEQSAKMLMGRLAKADPGEGWHIASRSISYFDPAHGPFCERQLGENLEGFNVELIKLSIEALGRCGHSRWGYVLRDRIEGGSDYHLEKFGSHTAEAVARLFVRCADEQGTPISGPSGALRQVLAFLKRASPSSLYYLTLRWILGGCDGRHADEYIQGWLTSENRFVVGLAADILGDCRILRAVPTLLGVMESHSDPEVVRSCSKALGRIGTEEAVERLLAAPVGSDLGAGLAFALEGIEDPTSFRSAVGRVLDSGGLLRFLALRAIGRRRSEEFLRTLRAEAEGPEPVERGVAALALARIGISDGADRFRRMIREASDEIERVFTSLAVLTAHPSSYSELEGPLRGDLAKNSYLYWSELQTDVLEVLEQSGDPAAFRLGEAWRPFYRHGMRASSRNRPR